MSRYLAPGFDCRVCWHPWTQRGQIQIVQDSAHREPSAHFVPWSRCSDCRPVSPVLTAWFDRLPSHRSTFLTGHHPTSNPGPCPPGRCSCQLALPSRRPVSSPPPPCEL